MQEMTVEEKKRSEAKALMGVMLVVTGALVMGLSTATNSVPMAIMGATLYLGEHLTRLK